MSRITTPSRSLSLVGFDADDTLWKSEDYYRAAEKQFQAIVGEYIDITDPQLVGHLLAVERRNLGIFGYGAKGMTLSMLEAAIEMTAGRISTADISRILQLGHDTLRHPVQLLDGVREAVAAIAADYPVVLITKGDLFHQESKIERAGLHDVLPRIEVVSEKDPATYARVLAEFGVAAENFVMIGNSLRSDAEPVLALGGWAVHMPYALTWAHEQEHGVDAAHPRLRHVSQAAQWPQVVAAIAADIAAGVHG
ncbi:HAD family hydrolase [Stenotrophomonas sp. W1S232]|uniref:HAD family hydrolase n=1 Tax=Stenotrophomonas koreensis TaxID=266128 RepID=A0A7W3V217_9GAMM|nr:HAD family hydrolase [Stenotrophomonas koreensis]MBB1118063.1 HAD family hydrolase [Stenotrophomonas koreensis]